MSAEERPEWYKATCEWCDELLIQKRRFASLASDGTYTLRCTYCGRSAPAKPYSNPHFAE